MTPAQLTPAEARAILGLGPDASPHEVIGAFRAAAKRAHPDRPGGDPTAFREILGAYRLLQSQPGSSSPPEPLDLPPTAAYVEIGPLVALRGGEAEARLEDGGRLKLRVPPGARHGETLRVAGTPVLVRIMADPDLQVRGSDLWITGEVAAFLLEEGGRARVATPLGEKVLWISRKIAERGLVRLEGQGLPARGEHPQGSLFIRLVADSEPTESPARAQLRKFAAAWAA
jgi:curved DNA-binding protein